MAPLARILTIIGLTACASVPASTPTVAPVPATLAQIYYWRAKPGKLDEYSRYITGIAERIDGEAQRQGAFLSVTTYVSADTASPWTHMRVFLLRDSTQLQGLSAALDLAGTVIEPDSVKRRERSTYSATLRDRVGSAVVQVIH
ncbi:MAG: hypothetical protein U0132_23595 [Gemmatimonadaceae bacterium]